MFHFILAPAAVHSLCQIALSPEMVIPSFLAANSLSKSRAVTSRFPFSTHRCAVSFTTAKASGRIFNNVSSICSSIAFDSLSIFSNNSSFSSMSVDESAAFISKAFISSSRDCFSSEINC